jgi:hypothetical protein
MRISDVFAIFTQILNFVIVLYFVTFLVQRDLLTTMDLIISFIGLFASILSNIFSNMKGGENEQIQKT